MFRFLGCLIKISLCVKSVRIWGYSGPHFPAFGLNSRIWKFVSLHIQSECGKMRTRITPNTDTFYIMSISVLDFSTESAKKRTIYDLLFFTAIYSTIYSRSSFPKCFFVYKPSYENKSKSSTEHSANFSNSL